MTGLTRSPVYFLRMNGALHPNLVVKDDARAGAHPGMSDDEALVSIKWVSNLMKNVNNPLVTTKIMTANKVGVFRQAVAAAPCARGARGSSR